MTTVLVAAAFVVAAAAGSVLRAEICRRFNSTSTLFAGTLAVNVFGSLLAGLCSGLAGDVATIVLVAFLGAFTTVSSFAVDTNVLAERRDGAKLVVYVTASALGSVLAAILGRVLTPFG